MPRAQINKFKKVQVNQELTPKYLCSQSRWPQPFLSLDHEGLDEVDEATGGASQEAGCWSQEVADPNNVQCAEKKPATA